jgi:hypothetical protein
MMMRILRNGVLLSNGLAKRHQTYVYPSIYLNPKDRMEALTTYIPSLSDRHIKCDSLENRE